MDLEQNDQATTSESIEDDNDVISMERKFISLYHKQTVLWDPNHPEYNNRYKRNIAYDSLLPIYRKVMPKATKFHIRQKINILRSSYRKDIRKYLASRIVTPEGKVVNTYTPTSWKFHALSFLNGDDKSEDEGNNKCEVEYNTEENTSAEFCEDEQELEFISHPHLDSTNDESYTFNVPSSSSIYIKDEKQTKHWNSHNKSYDCGDNLLVKEYNAISSNVSCKLQRMKPQQRYHAELLINKVLIYGLNERLTDDTNLTDVWRIDELAYGNDSGKDGDNNLTELK